MNSCCFNHLEIIHDEGECPLCVVKEDLRDAEQELCNREHALLGEIEDLEDQIKQLEKELGKTI